MKKWAKVYFIGFLVSMVLCFACDRYRPAAEVRWAGIVIVAAVWPVAAPLIVGTAIVGTVREG